MAKVLRKFNYDEWKEVTPDELTPGDIFSYGDVTAVFKSINKIMDTTEKPVINADPLDQGPIRICLGEPGWEYIVIAMDRVGSSCESFDDGTTLIAEFDSGNTLVYSPRLPTSELNEFCRLNMSFYNSFYDKHADAIDDGEKIRMEKFW